MNITPDSAIAFAVILVALALGWLWHEKRVAIEPPEDPRDLPCIDAAAAVLAAELWPELREYLDAR